MTVPNIQNAHDPETRNIINRNIDVTNELGKRFQDLVAKGQLTPAQYAELLNEINSSAPKGVYDSLEDLKSAYPNGDDGIYITKNNGHWNYFNGSTWMSGGIYQATGLNNNSIELSKIKNTTSGKNMFDKSIRKQGKYLDPATKTLINSANFDTSEFLSVVIGETYTINNPRSLGHFNSSKSIVGDVVDNWSLAPITFTATQPYIQVSFKATNINSSQIERGSTVTSYEPYKALISSAMLADEIVTEDKIKKGILNPEHFSQVSSGKNMFDKSTAISGYLDPSTMKVVNSATYYTSDFIRLNIGGDYTLQESRSIVFYNSDKTAVDSIDNTGLTDLTFTAEYPFVRFSVVKDNLGAAQIERGKTATSYEPYKKLIALSMIEPFESGGGDGEAYDQSLNTTDEVHFSNVTTYGISSIGEIPKGTLSSLPSGLVSGDVWADTTDSTTHPILRVKL